MRRLGKPCIGFMRFGTGKIPTRCPGSPFPPRKPETLCTREKRARDNPGVHDESDHKFFSRCQRSATCSAWVRIDWTQATRAGYPDVRTMGFIASTRILHAERRKVDKALCRKIFRTGNTSSFATSKLSTNSNVMDYIQRNPGGTPFWYGGRSFTEAEIETIRRITDVPGVPRKVPLPVPCVRP